MIRDEILAMPAGRELDALIAEKVMGCKPKICEYDGALVCGCGETCNYPHAPDDRDSQLYGWLKHYSTDIAAAWEVVEKMHSKGAGIEIIAHDDGSYFCVMAHAIPDGAGSVDWGANAIESNAPLAICRAALLATYDDGILVRRNDDN